MTGPTTVAGPHCQACNATEADCARMGRCCTLCDHFTHLDANGNEPPARIGRPPRTRTYPTTIDTLGPKQAARLARVLQIHQAGQR